MSSGRKGDRENSHQKHGKNHIRIFRFALLTDAVAVWGQWFVVQAEQLSDIVEVWMLHDDVPFRVVHAEVEVCDGDLHPPVVLEVLHHVPVDSYRAHVGGALDERLPSPLARAVDCRS